MGVKRFALNVNDVWGASNFLKRNDVESISDVTAELRGLRRFLIKGPGVMGCRSHPMARCCFSEDSNISWVNLAPKRIQQPEFSKSPVSTREVIYSLLASKRHKRVKPSTLQTYEKRLAQFEKHFPRLPLEPQPIMEYLGQLAGATGRHRRNHQDIIKMLYEHAAKCFGLRKNPMLLPERTMISTRPIRTLSLD